MGRRRSREWSVGPVAVLRQVISKENRRDPAAEAVVLAEVQVERGSS